ncbi:1-deoxy-D-xylulose-5-phosphate synthase [bacterium]|nr:MAG: 1-deoxy-D-xylulose-5-phosphate synthase [bacterium]
MRTAFINTLEEIAKKDRNIFLLTADLGFITFDGFRMSYPDRFINVGVAEANMIGIAAGLALSGKNVYCYSIIPFLTMRCLEQIRIDLCYQDLSVKLIGSGGGLAYGLEGMTHHSIEDVAIMRSLPNMTVISPGDPLEVGKIIKESVTHKGPLYIRLGKRGEPNVHESTPEVKIGKGIIIYEGGDLSIIATGTMLHLAKVVSNILKKDGINVNLISMHTIKPLDKEILCKLSKKSKAIFTIEEHSIIGGLGSAVAELLIESGYRGFFKRIGIPDKYCLGIGNRDYLCAEFSLTTEGVLGCILKSYKKEGCNERQHCT